MNQPVFLERRSYRRRRIGDALRLLPIFGLMMWMLPLFWPVASDATANQVIKTSTAMIYVFGVWMLLIAAAFGLALISRQAKREGARRTDA